MTVLEHLLCSFVLCADHNGKTSVNHCLWQQLMSARRMNRSFIWATNHEAS